MNLDPRYLIAPALEQFYINKQTGLPLANGKITFYKDNQRTRLKPIYTLSGSPPNYSYVELPNPLFLSAIGTIQDSNGNNVIPFYFPYDKQGNLELYYVTVYSHDGMLQFTREGWPTIILTSQQEQAELGNFIPNGQFLIHNDILIQNNKVLGEITHAITTLAPGGWTFNRSDKSSAKDLVTFERFGSAISNPTGYPRYSIRIANQLPGPGDLIKDLRISFSNVNRFASSDRYYTFSFAAQTNTGNNLTVTVLLIKDFGKGGSTQEEKIIDTVTVNASYSQINIPFIFGENQNKTLGINDDDSVAIALRFPTTSVFDVSLTDFILTSGNTVITEYPPITDSITLNQSLTGSLPTPKFDGADNYLPIVHTPKGFIFHDGDIGKIFPTVYEKPNIGELLCSGERYLRTGYSPESIPYSRLAKKLWNSSTGYYLFGNGKMFVTATQLNNQIMLTSNQAGAARKPSAGTSGFSINTIFGASDFGLDAFISSQTPHRIIVQELKNGSATPPDAKTSGFKIVERRNSIATKHRFEINCIDAKNLAGKWFQFSTSKKTYGIWFTVDGKGSNPVPKNLTPALLSLLSTQTARDLAIYLAEFLAGHQLTTIQCLSGKAIKPGSYFTFSTSTPETFHVQYGVSNTLSPLEGIIIAVERDENDTATEIAQKTKIAINQFYFAVPDLRDAFIRGWNKDGTIDVNDRYFSYGQGLIKNTIGSFQLDEIYSHNHPSPLNGQFVISTARGGYAGAEYGVRFSPVTGDFGGAESRPSNFAANLVIKY